MKKTTNTATTLNGTTIVNGSTTCTTGATLTYASGGAVWSDRVDDVKDYIDFVLELMGIDLDFQRFSKMTAAEKKAMIREIKIDKIID